MSMPRRVLTDEEKRGLRVKWPRCYICDDDFKQYSHSEIEFDHIHDYASGNPQELSNFAPVHAAKDSTKKNCHQDKGRKSPFEYKEELRIKKMLSSIHGLKDLHPKAKQSTFMIDPSSKYIELNGERYPLFSQRLNGIDNLYFFAEIPTEYIESDDAIQLRPLDNRIVSLTFSLRRSLQLLPSLARLEKDQRRIKVFDGQHKAVAQIVGNNRNRIACIVFIDPDLNSLRKTVTDAHSEFVQQRYAPSHIHRKLAVIYESRIKEFQRGDPNMSYSEYDILRSETKAKKRGFLFSSIIDGLRDQGTFINRFVHEPRGKAIDKPIPYRNIEIFIETFSNLNPVNEYSGAAQNYRHSELENLQSLLDLIEKYSLKDKWDAQNPDSATNQIPNLCYLTHPFKIWIGIYQKAIRYAMELVASQAVEGALCYRKAFSAEELNRIDKITERLFKHGLWLNPSNVPILRSIYDEEIKNLFKTEKFDHMNLNSIG